MTCFLAGCVDPARPRAQRAPDEVKPLAITRFLAAGVPKGADGQPGPLRLRAVAEDGSVWDFVEGGRPPWREIRAGEAFPGTGYPTVFVPLVADPWQKPLLAQVGMDMGRVSPDGTIKEGAKLRREELEKATFVGFRKNPSSYDFFVFRPPEGGRPIEFEEAKMRRDRSVAAPLPVRPRKEGILAPAGGG